MPPPPGTLFTTFLVHAGEADVGMFDFEKGSEKMSIEKAGNRDPLPFLKLQHCPCA